MSAGSQLVVQTNINWQNFGHQILVFIATCVDDHSVGAPICSGAVRATGRNAPAAHNAIPTAPEGDLQGGLRLGFSGFLVVYNGLDMKVKRILAERGLAAIAKVQSVERKTPGVQCPLCGKMVEALTESQPGKPACYECCMEFAQKHE